MNLKSLIREDLWSSVKDTYEASNYSHAINDGMIHLSNKLREKGDVDGDGVDLVSKTLSLSSPKIKLNKLQTKTDKVIQEGFYFLVRGLYQAIRDPRSHESHMELNDTKETADSILLFLNFVLENIEKAKGSFVLSDFKSQVFDKDFLNNVRYAELLVKQIPPKKRFDTLIDIYRDKTLGDIYNVSLVIRTLFSLLSLEDQNEFIMIISDELNNTNNRDEIQYNLMIVPDNFWNRISEISRLRIEGIVIKSLEDGWFENGILRNGGLATFARRHMCDFLLIENLKKTFFDKFNSGYAEEELYVVKYFLVKISEFFDLDWRAIKIIRVISQRIKDRYEDFEETLIQYIKALPDSWQERFQNAFKDEPINNHKVVFLTNGTSLFPSLSDDEIPF